MAVVTVKRLKDGMFSDPRTGWSAYPFLQGFGTGKTGGLKDVHVVSISPGQVRGNHYHENSTELLFFFAGRGELIWEEDGRLREERLVGTPTLVTIPPGIKHAFRNSGDTPVFLLAVRDGDSDPMHPDTVRSEIV